MRQGLLVMFFLISPSLLAQTKYFAMIFGVQDRLNTFTQAHTFGIFVQADKTEKDYVIQDTAIISWLPASGKVRLFVPAEKGRNYPIDESLSEPAADGRKISMWGPFETKEELFLRAKKQNLRLDNNEILYQAVDEPNRKKGIATNCEHAVSDIDTDKGYLNTGIAHGNKGSHLVAKHLRRWYVSLNTFPEMVKTLGLNIYPIISKKL